MIIGRDNIKDMNSFVFNNDSGSYQQIDGFLTGKASSQIAEENGVTHPRVVQWAREHKVSYIGTERKVHLYVFDAASELAFADRPKESPGRRATEKPPKVPGKPGRPRKEKPADTGPKNPVGRPRKHEKEGKKSRGRPPKTKRR